MTHDMKHDMPDDGHVILCLDVGNTNVFAGVLVGHRETIASFRFPSGQSITMDTFGMFLLEMLRHHGIALKDLNGVCLSSVVPSHNYSIMGACREYLNQDPLVLSPADQDIVFIDTEHPEQLGSDRVANAIGALHRFPGENLIILDFGTATTVCAVENKAIYRGGAILPGMRLSMESLAQGAALLSMAPLEKPRTLLGRTTAEQIQCGIYYGALGAINQMVAHYQHTVFAGKDALVVGTGGLGLLLAGEPTIHVYEAFMTFSGLYHYWVVMERNRMTKAHARERQLKVQLMAEGER